MIGVVLCGGASTRMGKDKGLLVEKDQTWTEIAAEKLGLLHLPVVLSVNKMQVSTYASTHSYPLLSDNDGLPVKGPLLGLLSVHLQHPEDDLLVLACDMKEMSSTLLQPLLFEFNTTGSEAVVYCTENRPQPLCGIYSARGLKKIYALLQEGELKRFSMMHVLETLQTLYVSAKPEELPRFNNYNSPEDL